MLGLNNFAEPLEDNLDPFIACSFVSKHLLFINFFHSHPTSMEHYHFMFDLEEMKIEGELIKITNEIFFGAENFPV